MGKQGHGAVPSPGREHPSSSVSRDGPESAALTFGPGFAFYALPPIALLLGGALVYASLRIAEPDPLTLLFGPGMILTGLIFPIAAWTRYRLDEEGIARRTIGGRRHWYWDEIGRVRGAELEAGPSTTRIASTATRNATTLIRRTVYDPVGRPLFRISPWTKSKRQLATQIRRRSTG